MMSKGLYFAYLKAWRKENPASKYDLTPGAALMLRAIIDEINAQFWPKTPAKINNQYFYDTCNFSDRKMIKKYRDELQRKELIKWHRDAADKTQAGYYKLIWNPITVEKEIDRQIKEYLRRSTQGTPTPFKLAIVNG